MAATTTDHPKTSFFWFFWFFWFFLGFLQCPSLQKPQTTRKLGFFFVFCCSSYVFAMSFPADTTHHPKISICAPIENERELVWGNLRNDLIEIYLDFNWKLKEVGLGQSDNYLHSNWKWKETHLVRPDIESEWFLFRFHIEHKWKLVWGSLISI